MEYLQGPIISKISDSVKQSSSRTNNEFVLYYYNNELNELFFFFNLLTTFIELLSHLKFKERSILTENRRSTLWKLSIPNYNKTNFIVIR